MRSIFLGFLALAVVGCGDDSSGEDAGPAGDAGPPATDGAVDAGPQDRDAGPAVDCSDRPVDAITTRGELQGIYDEAKGRILIYGGDTAAPVDCIPMYDLVDEMWALHLDCNSWERLTPSGGPGIRARHGMTVDTMRNRAILYGGRLRAGFGAYTNFNDVWAFDLGTDTWEEIATTGEPPTPASTPVVAYDEINDRLIVFGGNVSEEGLTLTGTDELHALDLATGAWTRIDAAGAPEPRLWHGGVAMGGKLYVFGGTPEFDPPAFYDDMYAFDFATDTWTELHAGGAGAPADRFGGEIFADPARNRIVLLAGHWFENPGNANDTWAFDVGTDTWTQLTPGDTLNGVPGGFCDFPADFTLPEEGSPERRYASAHPQSAAAGYLIGGKTDCGNVNDVWRFDFATDAWEQVRLATEGEACNRTGRTMCSTLCF